jgi:hypothetical protein
MSALDAAERLKQDADALLDASRTVASDYAATGSAFRRLLVADLSLARDGLIRGLIFLLLCTLAAGTATLLLVAFLLMGLRGLGLSWPLTLLVPFLISVVIGWLGWVKAREALGLTELEATRRQLAAWFAPAQSEQANPAKDSGDTGQPESQADTSVANAP